MAFLMQFAAAVFADVPSGRQRAGSAVVQRHPSGSDGNLLLVRRDRSAYFAFQFIRRLFPRVLVLLDLSFLPPPAAFSEDALEKLRCGFDVGMGFAPLGGERAFHRRLEHGGPVLPELRPHALQRLYPGVEVGEQFVERVSDACAQRRAATWNRHSHETSPTEHASKSLPTPTRIARQKIVVSHRDEENTRDTAIPGLGRRKNGIHSVDAIVSLRLSDRRLPIRGRSLGSILPKQDCSWLDGLRCSIRCPGPMKLLRVAL